jgi:hypothetical protein
MFPVVLSPTDGYVMLNIEMNDSGWEVTMS